MFIEKGDAIIVEKPTYLGAIQAMSGYMPRFLPVDLSEDGPDLDQVELYCQTENPKFMYSIPNFQNPSGMCYNYESRERLANLLINYGLFLLEDEIFRQFSVLLQTMCAGLVRFQRW